MASKLIGAAFLACSVACGSSSESPESRGSDGAAGSFTSSGGSSSNGGTNVPGSGGSGGRPPEAENESAYLAPVVTGKYLWSANPLSGRVALIDAETLAVKLQIAGNHPTTVLGIESGEQYGALVLNDFSDDATLLRVDEQGELRRVKSFATQPDANAWSKSPSGKWAVAWSDAAQKTAGPCSARRARPRAGASLSQIGAAAGVTLAPAECAGSNFAGARDASGDGARRHHERTGEVHLSRSASAGEVAIL